MVTNTRTVEQIRAEVKASREAMAANVEGLVAEVHPTAVKDRAVNDAKTFVSDTTQQAKRTVSHTVRTARDVAFEAVNTVKGTFYNEQGVRWNNVASAVLVVAGVVAGATVLRGVTRLFR